MFDRYTKIVLTVIAVALSAIAVQGVVGPANAQMSGCGLAANNPCHVTLDILPGRLADEQENAPGFSDQRGLVKFYEFAEAARGQIKRSRGLKLLHYKCPKF